MTAGEERREGKGKNEGAAGRGGKTHGRGGEEGVLRGCKRKAAPRMEGRGRYVKGKPGRRKREEKGELSGGWERVRKRDMRGENAGRRNRRER